MPLPLPLVSAASLPSTVPEPGSSRSLRDSAWHCPFAITVINVAAAALPLFSCLQVKRAPHEFLARNSEAFLKTLPASVAPLSVRGGGTAWSTAPNTVMTSEKTCRLLLLPKKKVPGVHGVVHTGRDLSCCSEWVTSTGGSRSCDALRCLRPRTGPSPHRHSSPG